MQKQQLLVVLLAALAAPLGAQGKDAAAPKVITAVSAAVDLASYQGGPCPAKLTFTGTIVADKTPTAPVTYRWVHSDTTIKSPVRTLSMTSKAAVVTDLWPVGVSGQMVRVWAELQVLTPNAVKSARVAASVLCR